MGVDQAGEGQQDPGAGHLLAGAEARGGVIEHAHVRQQPIEPAIARIAVEAGSEGLGLLGGRRRCRDRRASPGGHRRRRHARADRQRGQVWVRRRRRLARSQRELLGARRGPAEAAQALADRLLIDPQPMSDGAVGQPRGLERADGTVPARAPRPAPRVPSGAAQGRQAFVVIAPLIPPERAWRAPEGPRDIVLIGPALLDQGDHRVRLGHAVVGDEVRERDAGRHDDALIILDAQHAAVVDDDRVGRAGGGSKQPGLGVVDHGRDDAPTAGPSARPNRPPAAEKADRFGSAPCRAGPEPITREIVSLCQEISFRLRHEIVQETQRSGRQVEPLHSSHTSAGRPLTGSRPPPSDADDPPSWPSPVLGERFAAVHQPPLPALPPLDPAPRDCPGR